MIAFVVVLVAIALALAWGLAGLLYPAWAALSRRFPVAARGTLIVALLPALLAVGVIAASVGPAWFESAFVCHSGPGWLHLCWCHPANALTLLPAAVVGLLALLPGRLRVLRGLASPRGEGDGLRIVDLPRPGALLHGWLRPSVVVDRRLWEVLDEDGRAALLAHEQAHIDRRDPLVLLLLRAATVFAPEQARAALLRAWLERAELRADALAVRTIGDPLVVAEALLRCARLQTGSPALALSWSGGSVERRVRALLGEVPADVSSRPDAGWWDALALAAVVAALVLASPGVHHHLEHLIN